jgi:transcriptional regulator with XRE-family HTH domain
MRRNESKFISPMAQLHAKQLGQAVRAARLARNSTQESMAERAKMSALTWLKIEKGEVSVAMGTWLSALELTGLLGRVAEVADQKQDMVGEQLRKAQLRKRARSSEGTAANFDF